MSLTRYLAAVLLVGVLPVSADARVGIVLPFGGSGVPALETGRVQRWLEAALANVPGHRWLAPSRLTRLPRSAARLAACQGEPRCLGGLVRQLGADLAVTGEVGSLGGGYMVYLQLIDSQGRSLRTANAVLEPGREGLQATTRGLAYQLLQPERYSGSLAIDVDVANAWIYVDGKRVARSPAAPIAGLAVGPHALRVTHEAYRDFVHFVSVDFGEETQVKVKLTAYPVRAEQMRLVEDTDRTLTDRELPWYRRWWAVATFGAVILVGATTAAALLLPRSTHRDAELMVRP